MPRRGVSSEGMGVMIGLVVIVMMTVVGYQVRVGEGARVKRSATVGVGGEAMIRLENLEAAVAGMRGQVSKIKKLEDKINTLAQHGDSGKASDEQQQNSFVEPIPTGKEVALSPILDDIECPPLAPSVHMEIPLEHLPRKKRTTVAQKYDRRAVNCNNKGLWSAVSREDHYKIMQRIAKVTDVKQNDLIFDWGSGCGHKLHWFAKEYSTSGMGVDLSYKSLVYAWENTTKANKYCYGDGSNLEWIPDNTFDMVFSFGSIFHVYNKTLMCRSYQEMVRIAKKGAKIFNGWTAEDEFPNMAVFHCFRDVEVEKVEIYEELKDLFKGIKTFPTKYKGYGHEIVNGKAERRLLRPLSYTHLITK